MVKAIAASKKKNIARALIIGLVMTLFTLAFGYKTTVTEYNDCVVGICAAYVSSESEAKARGYPLAIVTTTNPGASFEDTEISILGAVVDWIMYSFVALIGIIVLNRSRQPHS